jgi:hypothetical protein
MGRSTSTSDNNTNTFPATYKHTSGVQELLERAEQDWVQVARVDIKQIRKTLKVTKSVTRRRIA